MIEASDGAEAVRLFAERKPDFVLLDMLMPEQSGVEALRAIRKLDPAAKIAMLTTEGHEDAEREVRRAGALAFVVKPATADRLYEVIDSALG